jgi:Bacterial Ig-like domain
VSIINASNVVVDSYTTPVSSGLWSVNITKAQAQALADGTYTVTADISDKAGNPATEATKTISVDETTPTVTVSINSSKLTLSNNTGTVTFTFSEAPTSFTLAKTVATGGTLSNLIEVDPARYTAMFTAAANTLINNASVGVIASSWTEDNGNPGLGGTTPNFTVDTYDHWIKSASGDWATASNWSNRVPTATLANDIDASGTYTITITRA